MIQSVLAATPEASVGEAIRSSLQPGCRVTSAQTVASFRELGLGKTYDLILVDVGFLAADSSDQPEGEILVELEELLRTSPKPEVVVLAPPEKTRQAVRAVKAGATDYLNYPILADEIKLILDQIYETYRVTSTLDHLKTWVWDKSSKEMVKTNSTKMKAVFEKVAAVAPTMTTVLLTGETGVGKGVVARLIHRNSRRRDKPFISLHCGAIPETLIESELFGHEKGAFTGADSRRLGKFELARGGTIFLDEIGTITPAAQVKLLQVLQDRTFQRVGGELDLQADVRVIAATNLDLKELISQGRFRPDLFYRLEVFPIEIPPLRERLADIPHLIQVFLSRLNRLNDKRITGAEPVVVSALQGYRWPGNIRELENLIERAYILEPSSRLGQAAFPAQLFPEAETGPLLQPDTGLSLAEARSRAIEDFEQFYLEALLREHKGRIDRAAAQAQISTRQLRNLLAKYGLRKEDFKKPSPLPQPEA